MKSTTTLYEIVLGTDETSTVKWKEYVLSCLIALKGKGKLEGKWDHRVGNEDHRIRLC